MSWVGGYVSAGCSIKRYEPNATVGRGSDWEEALHAALVTRLGDRGDRWFESPSLRRANLTSSMRAPKISRRRRSGAPSKLSTPLSRISSAAESSLSRSPPVGIQHCCDRIRTLDPSLEKALAPKNPFRVSEERAGIPFRGAHLVSYIRQLCRILLSPLHLGGAATKTCDRQGPVGRHLRSEISRQGEWLCAKQDMPWC